MGRVVGVLLLLASVVPGVAAADSLMDELHGAANEAVSAWTLYCHGRSTAGVVSNDESLRVVTRVWAEVSAAYEEGAAPYLLFWRGALGLCIDRQAPGQLDLRNFLAEEGDASSRPGLVLYARQLLGRRADAVLPERDPDAPTWREPPVDLSGLAGRAYDVHTEHCARVSSGQVAVQSNALALVAETLGAVGPAYAASGESFLLYWRGVLGQCVGNEKQGVADLMSFSRLAAKTSSLSGLEAEAHVRIRRSPAAKELKAKVGGDLSGRVGAPLAIGIGLAAAAGGLAGLAAWQQTSVVRIETELVNGVHDRERILEMIGEGEQASSNRDLFAGVAIGCGAGALVSFVLAAALGGGGRRTVFAAAPTADGGFALGFSGEF